MRLRSQETFAQFSIITLRRAGVIWVVQRNNIDVLYTFNFKLVKYETLIFFVISFI